MNSAIRNIKNHPTLSFFVISGILLSLAVSSPARADNKETSPTGVIAVIPREAPPTYFLDAGTGQAAGFAVEGLVGGPEYRRIYSERSGKPAPYWTAYRILTVCAGLVFVLIGGMLVFRYITILRFNRRLLAEIEGRRRAEDELRKAHDELERKVDERTYDLGLANEELEHEISERIKAEATIKEKNLMLQTLIHAMPDQVFFKDSGGRFLLGNKTMEEAVGLRQEEFVGKSDDEISPPDVAEACKRSDAKAIKSGKPTRSEEGYTDMNGEIRFLDVVKAPIYDGKGELLGLVGVSRDITGRKRMEETLHESESRYHTLFEQSPDGILLIDAEGKILEFNEMAHRQLGYSHGEFAELSLADIDPVESPAEIRGKIGKILEAGRAEFDVKHRTKQGEVRDVHIITQVIMLSDRPVLHAIWHDVTEQKQAEEKILASLKEKEILLREIHHRVKNNLNVIISLLRLQSGHITEPAMTGIFEDCQNRIRSMALIHEKLYQTKDFTRVNYKEYIASLLSDLSASCIHYKNRPRIVRDIQDIFLDLDTAIPCGLIINELVTNALKYAFPDSRTGEVVVGLTAENNTYILSVSDNGIGLPEGFDLKGSKTLGLQLVNILVKQLGGTLRTSVKTGTEFRIAFGGRTTGPGNQKGKT